MSKSPPPPYESTPVPASSSRVPLPIDPTTAHPTTAHLSSHLASLPSLISCSQQAHLTNRIAQEITLVSLLTPPIASLLDAFATAPSLPPLAELTLVPAAAVPPDWSFTNASTDSPHPRRSGEIRRLERVAIDRPSAEKLFPAGRPTADERDAAEERSTNPYSNPYFDDWGRWGEEIDGGEGPSPECLWWNDEELARRLAILLQPASAPGEHPRDRPPAPPAPPREPARMGMWGMFKSPEPLEPARQARVPPGEGVGMTVRVEEVTFRKENQLGIWESRNGFGIVVRVRSRS